VPFGLSPCYKATFLLVNGYIGVFMNELNNPLLSVIICCYNSEQYLPHAVESILSQTYKNIEIVIVNDGSQGNFGKIISAYGHYKNIIFVENRENKGLFLSRIIGFLASKGKYIAFLDADDFISLDFYRKLISKAIESHADMTIGDTVEVQGIKGTPCILNHDIIFTEHYELDNGKGAALFMDQGGSCFTLHVVWNKIYTRSLIISCLNDLIPFAQNNPSLTMCEDIAFSSIFYIRAKKIVNVHNIYYFYNRLETSATIRELDYDGLKRNISHTSAAIRFMQNNFDKICGKLENKEYIAPWKQRFSRTWFERITGTQNEDDLSHLIFSEFSQKSRESFKDTDKYYIRDRTPLGAHFGYMEQIKREICKDDTKIVSFDVFDTLLKRPLMQPYDLFQLISHEANMLLESRYYLDFYNIRTYSETECRSHLSRQTGVEDISLDDIYDFMGKTFKIDGKICEKIKHLELAAEEAMCSTRNLGKELYDLAYDAGKTIICISDMYLGSKFVDNLLKKKGFNKHEKLYISSEIGLLKGSGNLYMEVCRQLGLGKSDYSRIIHIGDNWQSDIVVPRSFGFTNGFLPSINDRLMGRIDNLYSGEIFKDISGYNCGRFNIRKGLEGFVGLRAMFGLAGAKLFDIDMLEFNKNSDVNGNPYFLGYALLGPFLYALAEWILSKSERDKTIHFVSRDGWLPMQAVQLIAPNVKSEYFYFSRKAIAPLMITNENDLVALSTFIVWSSVSPLDIYHLLKEVSNIVDEAEFRDQCADRRIISHKRFSSELQFIEFLKLFYKNYIDQNRLKEYREKMKEYLASKFNDGDILYDSGYSGKNEEMLAHLIDCHVNSLYLYYNNDTCKKRENLSRFKTQTFFSSSPILYCVLRETLLSEPGPSCIGYILEEGKPKPIFDNFQYDFATKHAIEIIQMAALDFIRDYRQTFGPYLHNMYYRFEDAATPFEYFLHNAKEVDRNIFSNALFEDDLYGGATFNITDDWVYRQKEVQISDYIRKSPEDNVNSQELLKLKKTHEQQKGELVKIRRELAEAGETIANLRLKLDKRWIQMAILLNKLNKHENFSFNQIDNLNLQTHAEEEPVQAPPDFDESAYYRANPDVKAAVEAGSLPSGFYHYIFHGINEGRQRP